MTDLHVKQFPAEVFNREADAILRRVAEEGDGVAFERRFGSNLLAAVQEDPMDESNIGMVAFALALERAIMARVPDDLGGRCQHFRVGIGRELTVSLPHRTAYCAACAAEFTDARRIVMDGRCEVCRAEGSFTQIAVPLGKWRVAANVCDGCAAHTEQAE